MHNDAVIFISMMRVAALGYTKQCC